MNKLIYYIISVIITLGLLAASISYYSIRTSPFARLADLPVAGLTKTELASVIRDYEQTPTITLKLPDQEYVTSLKDLQMQVNVDALYSALSFPQVIKAKEKSRSDILQKAHTPLVIPAQQNITPRVLYDSERGNVRVDQSPKEYQLDDDKLLAEINSHFGQTDLVISPYFQLKDQLEATVNSYNNQLQNVFAKPLTIKLKNGSSFNDFVLGVSLLKQIVLPQTTDPKSPITLKKDLLIQTITNSLSESEKEYFNPVAAYANTLLAINSRFHGQTTLSVLGVDDGPSSDGSLSAKYLEIDISQQKMYFFIGGKLYKQYSISTGAEYPTPVGEFRILNKAPKAYSAIYDVWMPYWMAITYAQDIGAYIGIHEIAYAVSDRGTPFYRHGYYIGGKMTGGCIAMDPYDSREIYNLAEVGMLVRILD